MFIANLRRGRFVVLACAIIVAVCGRAMIAEALRRRVLALNARMAPPLIVPTPGPRLPSFPQQG